MMKFLRFLGGNLWPILSGATSLYFVWVFHKHAGFPPTKALTIKSGLYFALFVVFLLAPLVQRLRLGRLLEFETKVEEVRSGMKEVRTETRELTSTVSAVATAISASVNQSVVVNFPSSEWAQAAREEMSAAFGEAPEVDRREGELREYMDLSASDLNYALARLRMDLERELRRIVGRVESADDV